MLAKLTEIVTRFPKMLLTLGTNIFVGVKDNTSFGQQHKNSNIYVLARYSF